jgi:hypothetical protein
MVPPAWNDRATVAGYAEKLMTSATPTALALFTLDVCQPATYTASTDYYAHWGLTHFLLDGHHKMHAAAESRQSVQLLSLLSLDCSLATADQVTHIPQLRSQPPASRLHH